MLILYHYHTSEPVSYLWAAVHCQKQDMMTYCVPRIPFLHSKLGKRRLCTICYLVRGTKSNLSNQSANLKKNMSPVVATNNSSMGYRVEIFWHKRLVQVALAKSWFHLIKRTHWNKKKRKETIYNKAVVTLLQEDVITKCLEFNELINSW